MKVEKDRKLVGIAVRTNNTDEMNQEKSKIASTVHNYFSNQLFERINYRVKPMVTYSAYSDYESDYTGNYTYFIGEEVENFDDIPEGFSKLVIPVGEYRIFETAKGPMPKVVIDLWQKIWQMSENDLGGQRKYAVDFEIYDERSADPQNAIIDIYIGIK